MFDTGKYQDCGVNNPSSSYKRILGAANPLFQGAAIDICLPGKVHPKFELSSGCGRCPTLGCVTKYEHTRSFSSCRAGLVFGID